MHDIKQSKSVNRLPEVYLNVYLKKNLAKSKIYPDPIWNVEALGFFEEVARTRRRLKRLKVDIYIPPLTWTWPAAVYNAKWRADRQW